jgi:hypothetical protein
MNRRLFTKRGVAACAALFGSMSGSLTVAACNDSGSKELARPDESSRQPDLKIEVPVQIGAKDYQWYPVKYRAAVPGFELGNAKFIPKTGKTRLMVSIRFTSRSVKAAKFEIELLDEEGRVLHQASRTDELGPGRLVTRTGRGPDLVRNWDAYRAQWFDFPRDAREAKALRVRVRLQRG